MKKIIKDQDLIADIWKYASMNERMAVATQQNTIITYKHKSHYKFTATDSGLIVECIGEVF